MQVLGALDARGGIQTSACLTKFFSHIKKKSKCAYKLLKNTLPWTINLIKNINKQETAAVSGFLLTCLKCAMQHHLPINLSDRFARGFTKSLRLVADTFFAKRYGHRAVILETVAAVPGMVAGMWTHLKSLRQMRTGYGPKIRTLLSEAENERMHLMTFIEISKPNKLERTIVLVAQAVFWHLYFVIYVFFPRTAHRIVGYFEEEAVYSYTEYLREIDAGRIENVAAPKLAIDYWKLNSDATLRDVVIAVRMDEENHRNDNHEFANEYDRGVWS